MPKLAFDLAFADLYSVDGGKSIARHFVQHLRATDGALAERLAAGRLTPDALAAKDEATLLLDLAPHVEDFLARLFAIEPEVRALEARHHALAPVFAVRRQFVQRKAMNAYKADVAATFDGAGLRAALDRLLGPTEDVHAFERAFANAVTRWQQDE